MTTLEFCGSLVALIGDDGIRGYDCAERRETFHYVPLSSLSPKMSCLTWQPQSVSGRNAGLKGGSSLVAVGCKSGEILVLSVKRQKIVTILKDEECDSVTSIDWSTDDELFSGSSDGRVFRWDFKNGKKAGHWKGHDSSVGSIRCTPAGSELLSASRNIKLWDLKSNRCLATFSGHESPVLELRLSWSEGSCHGNCLIISAAKGDRYLYVWPFQQSGRVRKPLCIFAVATEPSSFAVTAVSDVRICTFLDAAYVVGNIFVQAVYVMVTGEDGHLDIFFLQDSPTGLSEKRVCSVEIETNENPSKRLPILAANMLSSSLNVILVYGFPARLAIELLHLTALKQDEVLKREDPLRSRSIALLETSISKVKRPIVSEKRTNFLFSEGASSLRPQKKSKRSATDVTEDSMEVRLIELFRETKEKKVDDEVRVANHSLAVLLVQGLHSKDREILTAVLQKTDEKVIRPTVQALPSAQIVPLLEHIGCRLRQEKIRHSYYLWLKHIVVAHLNFLTTVEPAREALYDIFRQINARMPLLSKIVDLTERLEFLSKRWSRGRTGDDSLGSTQAELKYQSEHEDVSDESEDLAEFEESLPRESLWTKVRPMPVWERGRRTDSATNGSEIDLRAIVSERRTLTQNGHARLHSGSSDEATSEDDSSS